MLEFTSKFPFIRNRVALTPDDFIHVPAENRALTETEKKCIREANDLLAFYGVPINKVRYTFETPFKYDVNNNKINPKFDTFYPKSKDKNTFPITIGEHEDVMSIEVGQYQIETLKHIVKKSKKGVVVLLNPLMLASGLYHEVLMANLDAAIDFHKNQQ